ncbi:uncharacterized protein LOC129611545 [Condylostylus longicornis]|uniref:uncharacterized protein LOC129611545 n=1 Tax=Condylostylus longicornis TaxID=2530218 RepID=UPI00244E24D8|nr:uncharacterized protein LOC129611545 [Condylostylus longicornis]
MKILKSIIFSLSSRIMIIAKFIIAIMLFLIVTEINAKVFERCELVKLLSYEHNFATEDIAMWICLALHFNIKTKNFTFITKNGLDNKLKSASFDISDEFWCPPSRRNGICGFDCKNLKDGDCVKFMLGKHNILNKYKDNALLITNKSCNTHLNLFYDCLYEFNKTKSRNSVSRVGKIYDRCELAYELFYLHKINIDHINTWLCIANYESHFNTSALGRINIDGSFDHGLFQINDEFWCSPPGKGFGCNLPCDKLRDSDISDDVNCIKIIYNEHKKLFGDGFKAWTVYESLCKNRSEQFSKDCFDLTPKPNTKETYTTEHKISERYYNNNANVSNITSPRRLRDSIKGKIFTPCELANDLRTKYDIQEDHISVWVCIAKYESNFNTSAISYSYHGMFQISDEFWCSPPGNGLICGVSCYDLEDEDLSDDVKCLKIIYDRHQKLTGDGFNAWSVYPVYCSNGRSKKYIENCDNKNSGVVKKFQKNPFLQKLLTRESSKHILNKNENNTLLNKSLIFNKMITTERPFPSLWVSNLSAKTYTTTRTLQYKNNPFLSKFFQVPKNIFSTRDSSDSVDKGASEQKISTSIRTNIDNSSRNQYMGKNISHYTISIKNLNPNNIFLAKYIQTEKPTNNVTHIQKTNVHSKEVRINKIMFDRTTLKPTQDNITKSYSSNLQYIDSKYIRKSMLLEHTTMSSNTLKSTFGSLIHASGIFKINYTPTDEKQELYITPCTTPLFHIQKNSTALRYDIGSMKTIPKPTKITPFVKSSTRKFFQKTSPTAKTTKLKKGNLNVKIFTTSKTQHKIENIYEQMISTTSNSFKNRNKSNNKEHRFQKHNPTPTSLTKASTKRVTIQIPKIRSTTEASTPKKTIFKNGTENNISINKPNLNHKVTTGLETTNKTELSSRFLAAKQSTITKMNSFISPFSKQTTILSNKLNTTAISQLHQNHTTIVIPKFIGTNDKKTAETNTKNLYISQKIPKTTQNNIANKMKLTFGSQNLLKSKVSEKILKSRIVATLSPKVNHFTSLETKTIKKPKTITNHSKQFMFGKSTIQPFSTAASFYSKNESKIPLHSTKNDSVSKVFDFYFKLYGITTTAETPKLGNVK